jgi:N utilization substance protein B
VAKSRRKAREAALRALYEVELGHSRPEDAAVMAADAMNLSPDLGEYALRLVLGVRRELSRLDAMIGPLLKDYDASRLAAIDRNLIRLASYELLEEPAVPPAVTINEAVEIAKRYSTAESGRFVNGVLGRLLRDTEKANWDPDKAPIEFEIEELTDDDEPIEIEERTIEADSPEAKTAKRHGWVLSTPKPEEPGVE